MTKFKKGDRIIIIDNKEVELPGDGRYVGLRGTVDETDNVPWITLDSGVRAVMFEDKLISESVENIG